MKKFFKVVAVTLVLAMTLAIVPVFPANATEAVDESLPLIDKNNASGKRAEVQNSGRTEEAVYYIGSVDPTTSTTFEDGAEYLGNIGLNEAWTHILTETSIINTANIVIKFTSHVQLNSTEGFTSWRPGNETTEFTPTTGGSQTKYNPGASANSNAGGDVYVFVDGQGYSLSQRVGIFTENTENGNLINIYFANINFIKEAENKHPVAAARGNVKLFFDNCAIDLGEQNVTGGSFGYFVQISNANGGAVTVYSGKYELPYAFKIEVNGSVTLNGGTFTMPKLYQLTSGKTITISGEGAELVATGTTAISDAALTTDAGATIQKSATFESITIKSGTGYTKESIDTALSVSDNLVINGGTFETTATASSTYMFQINKNKSVTITGGSFNLDGGAHSAPRMFSLEATTANLNISGGTFALSGSNTNVRMLNSKGTVNISNGTFTLTSTNKSATGMTTAMVLLQAGNDFTVSGGEFRLISKGLNTGANKERMVYIQGGSDKADFKGGTFILEAASAEEGVVMIDNDDSNEGDVVLDGASFGLITGGTFWDNTTKANTTFNAIGIAEGEYDQTVISDMLDLADKLFITGGKYTAEGTDMFSVTAGKTVDIGGGEFILTANTSQNKFFNATGGAINISGGEFVANSIIHNCRFFNINNCAVTISGGEFTLNSNYTGTNNMTTLMFLIPYGSTSSKLTITGGEFVLNSSAANASAKEEDGSFSTFSERLFMFNAAFPEDSEDMFIKVSGANFTINCEDKSEYVFVGTSNQTSAITNSYTGDDKATLTINGGKPYANQNIKDGTAQMPDFGFGTIILENGFFDESDIANALAMTDKLIVNGGTYSAPIEYDDMCETVEGVQTLKKTVELLGKGTFTNGVVFVDKDGKELSYSDINYTVTADSDIDSTAIAKGGKFDTHKEKMAANGIVFSIVVERGSFSQTHVNNMLAGAPLLVINGGTFTREEAADAAAGNVMLFNLSSGCPDVDVVINGGTFTMTNDSAHETVTESTTDGKTSYGIRVMAMFHINSNNNGSITVNGGKFVINSSYSNDARLGSTRTSANASEAMFWIRDGGAVKVNGGEFTINSCGETAIMFRLDDFDNVEEMSLDITNGRFTLNGKALGETMIYAAGTSTVNVSGGYFKANSSIMVWLRDNSTLNVSGGTFHCHLDFPMFFERTATVSLNISGGSFYYLAEYSNMPKSSNAMNVIDGIHTWSPNVTGGNFYPIYTSGVTYDATTSCPILETNKGIYEGTNAGFGVSCGEQSEKTSVSSLEGAMTWKQDNRASQIAASKSSYSYRVVLALEDYAKYSSFTLKLKGYADGNSGSFEKDVASGNVAKIEATMIYTAIKVEGTEEAASNYFGTHFILFTITGVPTDESRDGQTIAYQIVGELADGSGTHSTAVGTIVIG